MYWLHMLATVTWIGSLVSLALLVIPVARKVLDPGAQAAFLGRLQARLQGIGWFSLGVLVATGLFQMSSNPNYKGFLAITNPWSVAILSKHIVIAGMVLANVYLVFWLAPARQREELRQARGIDAGPALSRLQRRETGVLWVVLALSGVILALTAAARVSQ